MSQDTARDSTNMKDLVSTVMLFVPSVEGISHNLNEFTKDEDLLAGIDHLTEVLRRIVTDPSVVAGAQEGLRPRGWLGGSGSADPAAPVCVRMPVLPARSAEGFSQPRRCGQQLHSLGHLVALVEDRQKIGHGELRAVSSATVAHRDLRRDRAAR